MLRGQLAYKGERGYSAYEIAVQNGYTGTEEEWANAFLSADYYYTKTEADTLLAAKAAKTEVYLKGDYAVVTGSIEYEEGKRSEQVTLDYPTGYTKENCIIVPPHSKADRNGGKHSRYLSNPAICDKILRNFCEGYH